jgi:ABC-type Mn2+/Zn2+ transport system ATPase subunit
LIDIVDSTVHRDGNPLLKNINFHIDSGEPLVMVGPRRITQRCRPQPI